MIVKKQILVALAVALLSSVAGAGTSKKFLTLEDAALAQAKKWQQTGVAKPIMSDDGKVLYPFGQYMPTITCAPMRACDVELEPGENVSGKPMLGDSARWLLSKAQSGSGEKRVTHIVVKPTDTGLETNMIVTTDRRTYHMRLYSSANDRDYMNRAGFYYPQDIVDEWNDAEQTAQKRAREEGTRVVADLPPTSVEKLDFGYSVDGDKTLFNPTRVFNDGTRTYIQMPEQMKSAEAPVLLLLDREDKPQIVNYRVKDAYYIVDKLFDRAMLVVGVDSNQSKVTITWNKAPKRGLFW
ncbi:P-type conjugative transfer protein TrbG [Cupriavidus sp. D39]|uniref:P-type conjugative transfer protein TrbG n=1 Tax=Cupriavidus sp. D39 TaxID=2997877 RepID=UPI00226F554D|nr:P-type conjugative transfer protein TrbG [Cupriavidus sp. D39]MCY0853043.1 P-type conjugative transfer protein TrbG [Cupriavidus sp. D39]